MKKRVNRYVALVMATLMASACATAGGGNSGSLTQDQKALRDYTADYAVTGALAGAALGCVAGALLSNNKGAGCIGGAAVGGVVGAGGGYYLAQRQKTVGQQSVDYAGERDALNREVQQAQDTVKAAHRVAVNTKDEIRSLKRQVASSQASQQQLQERVEVAKQDRAAMEEIAKKLQANIEQLDKDIGEHRGDGKNIDFLRAKRRQLEEENRKLKTDMAALDGLISSGIS